MLRRLSTKMAKKRVESVPLSIADAQSETRRSPKGSFQGNRELRRQQIPIHMFPNEALSPEPMDMSAMHTRHEYRLDAFFGHRHLPRRREVSAQRFSASSCCRTRTG